MAKITIDGVRYELLKRTSTARVDAVEREYKNMKSYTIPEKVTADGMSYTVTEIGNKAFNNCPLLEEVIIPDTIKLIETGNYWDFSTATLYAAFKDCRRLKSLTLPNSLTFIGRGAFNNCTGLTSVVIPNSVTYLAGFYGCTGLTSVVIPSSVTEISWAFNNCSNLTSVIIENKEGAVKIHNDAFKDTNAKITYVGKPKDGAMRITVEVPTLLALLDGKATEKEVQAICQQVKTLGEDAENLEKRLKKCIK